MKSDMQYECIDEHCRTVAIGKNRDVRRCPRCKGPIIPKPLKNKEIEFDGFPIELPEITEPSLLHIELSSFGEVPKVFYQGEEITGRISVNFDWQTKDAVGLKHCSFEIVHCDRRDGDKNMNIRTISHQSLGKES